MNIDKYNWHDSVIESILIDRKNPGINDSVVINIRWTDNSQCSVFFRDVYWANFEMNFGIEVQETILNAYLGNKDDKVMRNLYLRWKGLIDNIELYYFVFELNSTGSRISIISKSVEFKD